MDAKSSKLKPQGNSAARHAWIEKAAAKLRTLLAQKGFPVPDHVRVSVGWPKGARGNVIGQCWGPQSSADGATEVFVSPELGHTLDTANALREASTVVLATLAHELVHAAVGVEAKHKRPFKRGAVAIGLTGKMTATVAGDDFKVWALNFIEAHGNFPGGALRKDRKLVQTTRLLKCECADCGYIARVSKKWVEQAGTPVCPIDAVSLKCDNGEEE